MAWIMRNSAGATVERRPEPYLGDGLRQRIAESILPRYPTKRAALLPVLHLVQEAHGWLPPQALEEIAAFLALAPSEVADTVSFYEMFFVQPRGRHVVAVCQSLSCEILNHHEVVEALEQRLGVECGETTPDGKVTLTHVECLGSCGSGPCALVNDRLYENLTAGKAVALIDALL